MSQLFLHWWVYNRMNGAEAIRKALEYEEMAIAEIESGIKQVAR